MTRRTNPRKKRTKIFYIMFMAQFSIGIIALLSFYAQHFIALNTYPNERINFFGTYYDRTFFVDYLLTIGIVSWIILILMMLLFTVYLRDKKR